MVCFSERNGPAWNHFTEGEIRRYFSPLFRIEELRHISSLEGDNVVRHFYSTLMSKKRG